MNSCQQVGKTHEKVPYIIENRGQVFIKKDIDAKKR